LRASSTASEARAARAARTSRAGLAASRGAARQEQQEQHEHPHSKRVVSLGALARQLKTRVLACFVFLCCGVCYFVWPCGRGLFFVVLVSTLVVFSCLVPRLLALVLWPWFPFRFRSCSGKPGVSLGGLARALRALAGRFEMGASRLRSLGSEK
jgi:hypothetical protein